MKAETTLTHIDNEEDKVFLRSKLPDVNMRLFNSCKAYRKIILACCEHIAQIALTKFDDYKLPHGTSGANVAIPFNIIALVHDRDTEDASAQVMINPKILNYFGDDVISKSNCGSIRLPAPIEVRRKESVEVGWYDTKGFYWINTFHRENGSLTIQHEVDHNQGILITDRVEIKYKHLTGWKS